MTNLEKMNELVGASADKDLTVKISKKYKEGMAICREQGCTRIVDGKCLGWKDPLYMWENYLYCPHFSDDKNIVKKTEQAIEDYEKRH